MKIVVTGSTKLAGSICERFNAESVRIEDDVQDCDVFINCAHVGFEQVELLEKYYNAWRHNNNKLIINISSRAALPNLSKGHVYAAQKAALDHIADNITYNSDKKFRMTTINLGMLEDDISSVTYDEVCDLIEYILNMPEHLEIPRVFLQHKRNYQSVQQMKAYRYET